MHVLRKIIQLIMPYWRRILGGILLSLLVSGITAAIAWAIKPALDEVLVGKKYEYFQWLPIGVFLLFSVKGLSSFGQFYLMRSSGMKLVRETRNKLYEHVMYLPLSHFQKESSGMIISRVINDVENLNVLVSDVIKTFITEVPTVIFLLGVALYYKWDLTLMTLVLLPLIAYSTRRFGKGVKKKRKEAQRKLSLLTHRIGESILGSRIIKIFNREQTMVEKFRNDNQRYYRELMRVVRLKEFTKLVIDAVTGLGIAAVIWYGGSLVIRGVITPGVLLAVLMAIYMMFSPVKKLGEAYSSLQESRASLERIDTLLNTEHEKEGTRKIGERQVMANGQYFYDSNFSCASWDYPLGTSLYIFCPSTNVGISVKVTDRTARRFKGKRIDLSKSAFAYLSNGNLGKGLLKVKVEVIK